MATKKSTASSKKKSSSTKGRAKVKKVMHEYKHGELKSGGKKKVASRKQAVAIALSEARQSGAKIPKKGASKKKSSGAAKKKSSSRKRS
jgi:hypothetical protein